MKQIQFFFLLLSLLAQISYAQYADLSLSSKVVFKKGSAFPIREFYFNDSFDKFLILTDSVPQSEWVNEETFIPLGSWSVIKLPHSSKAFMYKGLLPDEVQKIKKSLTSKDKNWSLLLFYRLLIIETQASCENSSMPIQNFANEVVGKISIKRAIQNCHISFIEEVKKAFETILKVYTDFTLPTMESIIETVDTLKEALTNFGVDLVRALGLLAEKAPQLVEGIFCDLIKNNLSSLAVLSLVPGGQRQIPIKIAEIIAGLNKSIKSHTLIDLIERNAHNINFEKYEMVLRNISHRLPEAFRQVNINKENLNNHFLKHKEEFSNLKNSVEYETLIRTFAVESTNKILHYCSQSRCIKMHVDTGNTLIVSNNGAFVTMFVTHGKTPDDRFLSFFNKLQSFEYDR